MISRGIHDFQTLSTALTAATKYTYAVKIQRRRLDGFLVWLSCPGQTLTGATAESFAKAVKRIRVKVNDIGGSRYVVDAEGVALIDEWLALGGSLPYDTLIAYGNTGSAAFAAELVYPVFIRHPQLEEPAGNMTSIPLYDMREDLTLEIELGALTDVATSGFVFTSCVLRVAPFFRDVESGEYIVSEVISSDRDALASSSKVDLEIPSNGLLTSLTLQSYNSSAKIARLSVVPTTGDPDVTLWYGREMIRRVHPQMATYFNGLSQIPRPQATGAAVLLTELKHSFTLDLMDDLPVTGAFSARSALNLTSIRAGGDSSRLSISTTNATSPSVRLTTRKFLAGPVDKIQLA
jgi:hypothetical protein